MVGSQTGILSSVGREIINPPVWQVICRVNLCALLRQDETLDNLCKQFGLQHVNKCNTICFLAFAEAKCRLMAEVILVNNLSSTVDLVWNIHLLQNFKRRFSGLPVA